MQYVCTLWGGGLRPPPQKGVKLINCNIYRYVFIYASWLLNVRCSYVCFYLRAPLCRHSMFILITAVENHCCWKFQLGTVFADPTKYNII